jgi:hypothetical protein
MGVTRIDHDFDHASDQPSQDPSQKPSPRPVLKLHRPNDESAIQFSDTRQLQQLGRHLIRWRAELQKQQTQLQTEQRHWTKQMMLEHELIKERKIDLDNRQQQVKAMEFQLVQLQNDVIDAQVGLQQTVQALTQCKRGDQRDGTTIAALMTLRFELHQRFEYLVKRWEKLKQTM